MLLFEKPWIRIQNGANFLIRIQTQCIWIHNTDLNPQTRRHERLLSASFCVGSFLSYQLKFFSSDQDCLIVTYIEYRTLPIQLNASLLSPEFLPNFMPLLILIRGVSFSPVKYCTVRVLYRYYLKCFVRTVADPNDVFDSKTDLVTGVTISNTDPDPTCSKKPNES